MNKEKKIDKYLTVAPKPLAPDGLLDKLQADVSAQDIKTRRSAMGRWFAPTGRSISPWRVAAAAAIAIAVLMPLTYGAGKIIKTYIFKEGPEVTEVIEYEDGSVNVTVKGSMTSLSGDYADEEEAKKVYDEIKELKKAGKYERTLIREWVENGAKFRKYKTLYTLSSGEVITMSECEAEAAGDEGK